GTTLGPRPSPLFPYTTLFRSRGMPDSGQVLSASAKASWAKSSARGKSPRRLDGPLRRCGTSPVGRGRLGGGGVQSRLVFSLPWSDRKSTRLNSSHVSISYAVF